MNITCALIGHLVGDYLCQNDWMASNKKISTPVCLLHSVIWTIAVCLLGGITSMEAIAFLVVTHFLIDRWAFIPWWMHFIGQKNFFTCDKIEISQEENSRPEWKGFNVMSIKLIPGLGPWSVIVVDNIWHMVTIWVVYILT